MPVAFTSHGYDTTVDNPYGEAAWADAHPAIGSAQYGVRGPDDWQVSAVAGQDRTVSIAAGRGFGHGVTDMTTQNDTIQLSPVTSGSRWDLIVARRDWTPTAGLTKFEKIAGGSTTAIPSARLVGPGNIDDQPLAFVQVTAGQTQPTAILDLRCWAGDGGLEARSGAALQYLESPGTAVKIDDNVWRFTHRENGVWGWVAHRVEHLAPIFPTLYGNGFVPYTQQGWQQLNAQMVEGVVYINGATQNSKAWAAGVSICNFPAPYRPINNVQGVNCQVSTSGDVVVTSGGAANGTVSVAASFPISLPEV